MAFGLSARLLYRLALLLVLGFILYGNRCTKNIPWTQTRNVVLVLEILRVAYPIFLLTQGNLETTEVQRVYTVLNPQGEQICLY